MDPHSTVFASMRLSTLPLSPMLGNSVKHIPREFQSLLACRLSPNSSLLQLLQAASLWKLAQEIGSASHRRSAEFNSLRRTANNVHYLFGLFCGQLISQDVLLKGCILIDVTEQIDCSAEETQSA